MTMARETSMAIHSRADKWGSRVPEDKGGPIKEIQESFDSVTKNGQFGKIISYLLLSSHYHRLKVQSSQMETGKITYLL